jgi:pimeloyl-ACP methyl ester carboxylesterase
MPYGGSAGLVHRPVIGDWRIEVSPGVTIAGDTRGTDGPLVVLLHGLASTRRWWDLVADRLVGPHRVIRLDFRGHGRSSAPPDGYTIERLAADVAVVLDGLGHRGVALAGHSLGAAVALNVAAARPDLVSSLSCVDGGVYDPRLLFGTSWSQARQVMLPARRGQTNLEVLRAWLTTTDLPGSALPIVAANYAGHPAGGLRLRLDPEHEAQLAQSLWMQRPARALAALEAPVLVIGAGTTGDPRRWDSLGQARELLGERLRTLWLPGGHDLPLECPDEVAEALAGSVAPAASEVCCLSR